MPRRPHWHRQTQLATAHHEKLWQSKEAQPKATDFLLESEGAEHVLSTTVPLQNEVHDNESDTGTVGDEEDIDAPRIAQWIDDEDFELQEQMDGASHAEGVDDDDDHDVNEAGPSRTLRSLEDDLSTLPLGTLRSAQRSLAQVRASSDTGSDSEGQSEGDCSTLGEDGPSSHPANHEDEPSQPPKNKSNSFKRSNKHAPVEVTSKRPVSRRRVVIDDKLPKARDPRFTHATGRYDPLKFKQQYEFLSGLRHDELATLRGHVKRARKLLANSPAHLKAEREEEVKRLERAMKRAESTANLDNRERVEFKALQSAKQTEKEKRKQGKAGWWMKRSEKKELLAKARLDAIASVGGKQAVKKAIEKKQKKIGQKEKKRRPYFRSEGIELPDGKRRRPIEPVDSGRGAKRRKVI